MTRSTVLILSAAALLGCSKGSSNTPSTGPGSPSSGGPGATTEPQNTGAFNLAAAKQMRYPVRVASAGGAVYVTDAPNNQVLGIQGTL